MKRVISIFLCLIIFLFSLSACATNKQENILFLNDLIHCNITESGEKFGFNLLYLYEGKKPTIEFVSFDNQNTNSMFEEMIDDTIDSIVEKEYCGYKAVILGFCLDISPMEAGEQLQINSITLSINGKTKELDTTGQIIVNKISDLDEKYYCNSLYSTNVPVVLFSQGKNIEAASFNYHTEHSVTLEKFEFSDFLMVQDSCVYVDNNKIGNINDVFPLTVEANKTICIEINANFGDYENFSDYYINSLLHYKSDEDGTKVLKDYIAIQAVANFDDLSKLIDHTIQN